MFDHELLVPISSIQSYVMQLMEWKKGQSKMLRMGTRWQFNLKILPCSSRLNLHVMDELGKDILWNPIYVFSQLVYKVHEEFNISRFISALTKNSLIFTKCNLHQIKGEKVTMKSTRNEQCIRSRENDNNVKSCNSSHQG